MVTISNIHSARDFLSFIQQEGFSEELVRNSFDKYKYSPTERVLQISFNCNWCTIDKYGKLILTPRGKKISEVEGEEALFYQLEDVIKNFEPSWAPIIFRGREAAKSYLPDEIHQCFKEAGLFSKDLSNDLVDKWDKLARAYIALRNNEFLEIGREGEKLSIYYEKERTDNNPVWQSVEANFAGYDLLSIIDKENKEPLKIEVKATKVNFDDAVFYLSRDEWLTARLGNNYVFHLWNLEEKKLYSVDSSIVSKHIPEDKGEGEWKKVKIKFIDVTSRTNPVKLSK
jgi:hypothetical protein